MTRAFGRRDARRSSHVASLLFIEHGLMKLLQFPAPQPGAPIRCRPCCWPAAILECRRGLILVGLFTRVAAFICSGEMAWVFPGSWRRTVSGPGEPGDAAILFCFVFLYLSLRVPAPGVSTPECRGAPVRSSGRDRREPRQWPRQGVAPAGPRVIAAVALDHAALAVHVARRTQSPIA